VAEGIVRWFNETKGYGFIRPDDGDKDLFVHVTAFKSSGLQLLKAEEQVEFSIVQTPKGPAAVNVRLLDASEQMRRRAEQAARVQLPAKYGIGPPVC
jgi:cold shock protein